MVRSLPLDLRDEIDETSGLDLTDQDLHAYSFDGLNVRETLFTRSNLAGASFRNANVNGAQFYHATMAQAVFGTAHVHKVEFYHTSLTAASFLDASISRTDFLDADLSQVDFARASMYGVWFRATQVSNASLRDAVLKRVHFSAMDLTGLDVTGARFDDVWFDDITGLEGIRAEWILVGDELFHERLEGEHALAWLRAAAQLNRIAHVRWSNAGQPWREEPELVPSGQRKLEALLDANTAAPFAGTRLTRAAIEWLIARRLPTEGGVDLRGADLHGLHLGGLPLQGLIGSLTASQWASATPAERQRSTAQCHGTSFQGAHLEDALLVGVDLTEANLSGHLDRADFSYATLLDATVSPVSAHGACFDYATANGIDAAFADLRGSTWRNASLVGARFDFAKLDGADFTGADLRDATFRGASAEGTRFTEWPEDLLNTRKMP